MGDHTDMTGRRIAVTGAGSGIGRATALRLAEGGARVALLGRRRGPLVETAAACERYGAEALVIPCDVADEAAVAGAFAALGERWGALEGLVNNAGIARYAPLEETSLALWNEVLATNLTGPFLATRAALPLLRQGDRAAVVMVSSTLGLVGLRHAAAYCAAKAGVVNLARAVALEEAAHGIRVNAVCPGVTDTPMIHAHDQDGATRTEHLEKLRALHPVGRLGRPEDIAAAIVHLLAPSAAFITGTVLAVDGGQLAGFLE